MPPEGIPKLNHTTILSYEELYRIARSAVTAGIEKIRITGGEPLVRKGIVRFLKQLSALPGLRQLVLTTNGVLLEELSSSLRDAGVQRLNISLDSLDPATFAGITHSDTLKQVLAGIEKARSCGLPVKLNMVVMRGINDHEIADFARWAAETSCPVRFIEYMPAIRKDNWQQLVMPGSEILTRIAENFILQPLEHSPGAGPARNYRIAETSGVVGIITPVTEHFCSECNRIRVTSTGLAKGCLFSDSLFDLKPALQDESDQLLTEAIRSIISNKPASHLMNHAECHHRAFSMSSIGG